MRQVTAARGRRSRLRAVPMLHATRHGLVVIDDARVRAINHLHESLTIATLPQYCAGVSPKQMVATIKVIPFAVPRAVLEQGAGHHRRQAAAAGGGRSAEAAGGADHHHAAADQGLHHRQERSSVMRERLAAMGACACCGRSSVAHEDERGARPSQAHGGRAVIPFWCLARRRLSTGAMSFPPPWCRQVAQVLHLGMPVDPGNLLMLGRCR